MAITYNNLDDYLRNNTSDKIDDPDFLKLVESSSFFHEWNGSYFNVFKDSVNGYFHIPKDTIFKITKTIGMTSTSTGYQASADFVLKSTDSLISRSSITALYTSNADVKWYNSKNPLPEKAYLAYKNFDNTFDFKKTYSVDTYPWIKIDTNSYRDRMGDWDLNGNVKINIQQALCSSLKEVYKINGMPIWPGTYQKYTPSNNTWTPFQPELTTNPDVKEIDHSDTVSRQTVYQWPQRDYLFDSKYITSCDIEPVIGAEDAPYRFSDKYLTKFAQTKPADPESRKVEKMGFTSVKSLGKILQPVVETFDENSIKSLTVSWTDDTKTECNITANYDTKPIETKLWTKIPKDRSLGIMIRLPGDIWRQYNEERLKRPRDHRPPIQLPWFAYNETTQNIESKHGTPAYDWTWLNNMDNRPWYWKNGLGDFRIQLPFQAGRKPIPQLKILFSNKYYYVSTKLEDLFEGRGNVNSITILLYTGKFGFIGGDHITFDCSDDGQHVEFKIKTTAEKAGQQWGWNIKTLSHSGSMDNWDRGLIYLTNGQSEFNDLYNIVGGSDSNSLFSQLKVLNNIDLFTDNDIGVETITGADDFSKLFNAPQHQINGWITTCDPAGSNNGYITLDWSYSLVLKNRLLPYADQMFLPITDWKERHLFSGHDEVANETFSRFANNQDTSSTKEPFFGYNVGVRVFNASQNDCDRDNPIWEQGPWVGKTISIKYDGDMWNSLKNSNSLYGAYRKRYSMAYQFKHYSDTQLDKWFNWSDNPDHFIAPPVGLVLE